MIDAIFYDTETSDLSKRHCQVLQFAGIRADLDRLSQLDDINLHIRRLPYIVPAPEALKVTQLTLEDIDSHDRISEYQAAKQISDFMVPKHKSLRVFFTYNGIAFDDEVIRSMLWRNLMDPYITSGRQARRVDVMALIQLLHWSHPETLTIPSNDKGKPSWRLGEVAAANGIDFDAHDAMQDTRALLELTRIIRNSRPDVLRQAIKNGDARHVETLCSKPMGPDAIVWRFAHFSQAEMIPVIPLVQNRRQILAVNLLQDADHLLGLSPEKLAGSINRQGGNLITIRSNQSPLVFSQASALELFGHRLASFDQSTIMDNLEKVKSDKDFVKRAEAGFKSYASFRYQREGKIQKVSEDLIYSGFPSYDDKGKMHSFHRAGCLEERIKCVSFSNSALEDFAIRLIMMDSEEEGVDLAQLLSAEQLARFQEHWEAILERPHATGEMPWMTWERAAKEAAHGEADNRTPLGAVTPKETAAEQISFGF